ncbi:hypothetical protein BASA83_013656 [Batrachochytrium salamandrivorans]|nr:hypothetical protein BASA83_013656 [Batrachochytrium salamandrivorans]
MKKTTFEEMLESMSARLHLIEAENESLKMDAQESRAIANQAMLENTVSPNHPPYTKEPRVCLPDKFDGTRKHFRGFINQLELVFQLQSDRYNTDQKMIATLGTLLTGNALAWYNPYLEKPHLYEYDLSAWPRFKEKLRATFGEINQPSLQNSNFAPLGRETILRYLCGFVPPINSRSRLERLCPSSQFYFGLSYEIKDALVHFDTPSTLSLAVQQAIKVDNRLYERRLERTEIQYDMDIDFARRGPLTSEERQQRMSRGLCLVCGQSGHLKANCPKSNPNFRAPKSIRAIQIDDVDFESPGNDPGCL